VSSLTWEGFRQHELKYIFCPLWHGKCLVNTCRDTICVLFVMGGVFSTQVEIHFMSSRIWDRLSHHNLRYISCPCWHESSLVNTFRDTFRFLAGMGGDAFCVVACMERVWSTHVEIHFVSLLARKGFCQHTSRYILCPRWHGRGLVNTCCDTFCVLAGMVVNLCWDKFCVVARMGCVFINKY